MAVTAVVSPNLTNFNRSWYHQLASIDIMSAGQDSQKLVEPEAKPVEHLQNILDVAVDTATTRS